MWILHTHTHTHRIKEDENTTTKWAGIRCDVVFETKKNKTKQNTHAEKYGRLVTILVDYTRGQSRAFAFAWIVDDPIYKKCISLCVCVLMKSIYRIDQQTVYSHRIIVFVLFSFRSYSSSFCGSRSWTCVRHLTRPNYGGRGGGDVKRDLRDVYRKFRTKWIDNRKSQTGTALNEAVLKLSLYANYRVLYILFGFLGGVLRSVFLLCLALWFDDGLLNDYTVLLSEC